MTKYEAFKAGLRYLVRCKHHGEDLVYMYKKPVIGEVLNHKFFVGLDGTPGREFQEVNLCSICKGWPSDKNWEYLELSDER